MKRTVREDRNELWVSQSRDDGATWSDSRFLAVTSRQTTRPFFSSLVYCLTYCDVLADQGRLHIFIPHLWRQVLHVRMSEKDLERLPTRADSKLQCANRFQHVETFQRHFRRETGQPPARGRR